MPRPLPKHRTTAGSWIVRLVFALAFFGMIALPILIVLYGPYK
jgi:hypothetical protein